MIVSVLAGMFYMSRKILGSLTELSFHTAEIAKGNYQPSRKLHSNDELSKLSKDINTVVKNNINRNDERDKAMPCSMEVNIDTIRAGKFKL